MYSLPTMTTFCIKPSIHMRIQVFYVYEYMHNHGTVQMQVRTFARVLSKVLKTFLSH